jgi:hypothetical protein
VKDHCLLAFLLFAVIISRWFVFASAFGFLFGFFSFWVGQNS